jgi:hypothetical protein
MPLMPRSVCDAMSPRVICVASALRPRSRLLPCIESGRRSPCSWVTSPVVLSRMNLLGFMIAYTLCLRRGAVEGSFHLNVRRILCGSFRDFYGYYCLVGFRASAYLSNWLWASRTVASAHTNYSVPALGSPLPLPCSFSMGLNSLSLLPPSALCPPLDGTPPIHSVGSRLSHLAYTLGVGWLLWRLGLLIAWPCWWLFDVSQA